MSIAGVKRLLKPNVFNRFSKAPPRYRNRKLPFAIPRGFYDKDVYQFKIDEGLIWSELPEDIEINSQFGNYSASFKLNDQNQLIYTREVEIPKGNYEKEEYKDYRNFMRQVVRADKINLILNEKQ